MIEGWRIASWSAVLLLLGGIGSARAQSTEPLRFVVFVAAQTSVQPEGDAYGGSTGLPGEAIGGTSEALMGGIIARQNGRRWSGGIEFSRGLRFYDAQRASLFRWRRAYGENIFSALLRFDIPSTGSRVVLVAGPAVTMGRVRTEVTPTPIGRPPGPVQISSSGKVGLGFTAGLDATTGISQFIDIVVPVRVTGTWRGDTDYDLGLSPWIVRLGAGLRVQFYTMP
jgi:hypothetical protein